jgi:hypothetical protein
VSRLAASALLDVPDYLKSIIVENADASMQAGSALVSWIVPVYHPRAYK